VSAQISQQNFQYCGILNGVAYGIDPASGGSFKPMFEVESWRMPMAPAVGKPAPDVTVASEAASSEAETAETMAAAAAAEMVRAERIARTANLFPRSGGEPLRAGHPDLWALLVVGTCLEGSEYSPGS
jgi:hypothetical protein